MPTLRKQVNKGKFSNYGSSIFVTKTKNTEYFSKKKTPTLRGAFPSTIKTSNYDTKTVAYSGFQVKAPVSKATNKQIEKNNMVAVHKQQINKSTKSISKQNEKKIPSFVNKLANAEKASKAKPKKINSTKKSAPKKINKTKKPIFEGTAVKKPEPVREKTNVFVVPGMLRTKRLFHTTALSPMIMTAAKIAFISVIVVAIVAFVRVGISSATVTAAINSQELTTQIQNELETKNALEVQDSTLGNSSRIRSEATKMQLVTPNKIEHIKLGEDLVAYDSNGNVSMVESLNRVARSGK